MRYRRQGSLWVPDRAPRSAGAMIRGPRRAYGGAGAATSNITLDGTPATNTENTNTATLTVTFSTTGNPRLIVVALAGNAGNGTFPTASVADNSGVTGTWVRDSNSQSWPAGTGFTGGGGTEIWYAWATGTITSKVVTITWGNGTAIHWGGATVYALAGTQDGSSSASNAVGTAGSGFVAPDGVATSQLNASLTPSRNGSFFISVGFEGADGSNAITADANNTRDQSFPDAGQGATMGTFHYTGTVTAGSAISVGGTLPAPTTYYSYTAVEFI